MLLAIALVAGCAREKHPGVDALVVQTDLAFGVTPSTEAATPPPNVLAPLQPVADVPFDDVFAPPTLPPSAPRPICRTAGLTDFPEEPAARSVANDRRPSVGAYRWKREGEVRDVRFANIPIRVDGFEQRLVRNIVERSPDTDPTTGVQSPVFEFDTVQDDLTTRARVVRTWRIRKGALSVGSDASPIPVPGVTSSTTRAGEPDRGLALVRQVTTDAAGVEHVFAPATPLLVLPFPVRPGEVFSSSAVDPSTFQVMAFSNATVGVAERVDACGTVVEGWPVAGTFQFVGPTGDAVTFNYRAVVVPQLGGVIAAEQIDQGVEGGPGMNVKWRIGQVVPDRLP